MGLQEKLRISENPKRILSLDGGGVRGILTLGMLKKIEALVRQQTGESDLVLGDYYDLICGTSTGAIIACGLAIGRSVDEIITLYNQLGVKIFGEGRRHKFLSRESKTLRAMFVENYSSEKLEGYLKDQFQEITLGDKTKIRCGLSINAKRADTYSLWTVANHHDGKYYEANMNLKLWEICRASSAAPYYFKPKKLVLKKRNGETFEAAFIDGGISLANNPAFVSFLVATTPSFGFNWENGRERMFITSLGTGNGLTKEDPNNLEKLKALGWASKLSDLFMVDALEMNSVIVELIGNNLGSKYPIDSQFGDMSACNLITENNKLFSFVRHNVNMTTIGLKDLALTFEDSKVESLKEMDHYENMEDLLKIGRSYAEKNINYII